MIAKTIITNTADQTQKFAKDLTNEFKNGGILALFGDLGAGKTTFVQGFAQGLGIERRIISPTFLIVRKYKTKKENDFYHIDLYRVQSDKDIELIGLSEILENPQNIVAIEWAEKAEKFLINKKFNIHFKYINENKRELIVERFS